MILNHEYAIQPYQILYTLHIMQDANYNEV